MLRKFFIASLFIGSACAVYLELVKGNQSSVDKTETDLLMLEEQLPGMCWACKWVMKKLKKELNKDANTDIIKTKLLSVCDQIGQLKKKCKKMINKYLDVLIEELSTTDGPKTICANIRICK